MKLLHLSLVTLILAPGTSLKANGWPAGEQAPNQKTVTAANESAFPEQEADMSPALLLDSSGDVEISIRITPTEHSKALRLVADSSSHYRSTTINLQGAASEPLHMFVWRGFPPGDYDIVGILLDENGQEEVMVQTDMRVLARR